METEFTTQDREQIHNHNLTEELVATQLKTFEKGITPIQLVAAAAINNGILHLDETDHQQLIDAYETYDKSRVKFVPASGAASRMFKLLHEFVNKMDAKHDDIKTVLNDEKFKDLKSLFNHLQKLPFYDLVEAQLKTKHPNYSSLSADQKKSEFVHFLLYDMDYASLPKGLIPFHKYPGKTVTAFEEHLKEATTYAQLDNKAELHFTVTKDHLDQFESTFRQVRSRVEKNQFTLEASYSFQEKSTDTIAVNDNNQPFRDKDEKLVFRPGGHGALIQNLNKIDKHLVFIKNIDNVVTEKELPVIATYKRILAGLLTTIQDRYFSVLKELDTEGFSESLKDKAEKIVYNYFHFEKEFNTAKSIKDFFNRPLRVCGIVENTGAPGGGPFWVKDNTGTSLQIVEHPQINTSDEHQAQILENSTHFSPTDIVCGLKDYKGQKFDLNDFIDKEQGFITQKYLHGESLKALELPGLWNGSMAYWNTLFVEVPLKTFNPVKTVVDLLNPGHQVNA